MWPRLTLWGWLRTGQCEDEASREWPVGLVGQPKCVLPATITSGTTSQLRISSGVQGCCAQNAGGVICALVWAKAGRPMLVGVALMWSIVRMALLGVLQTRDANVEKNISAKGTWWSPDSSLIHSPLHFLQRGITSLSQRYTISFLTWTLFISLGSSFSTSHLY